MFSPMFFKIPFKISYDEAATVPLALSAAYVGLYNQSPHGLGFALPEDVQYNGVPLIVLGGSSSVGQMGSPIHFGSSSVPRFKHLSVI